MSKYSATGPAWQKQRIRVLDRDGWVCVDCGKALEGGDATVDHITPISLQPGHDYRDDELVSMCRRCNGLKQDKVLTRRAWFNPRWLSALPPV